MRNFETTRTPSVRAETIVRRTYSRPLENGNFETWDDIVGRVISHQRWLWQRALGDQPLSIVQEDELEELIDSLNMKGILEKKLIENLKKIRSILKLKKTKS